MEAKGVVRMGSPNHNAEMRSSAPSASPSPTTADPTKRQQGNNACPDESNSKKRQLAWKAEALMAVGPDVEFPNGEYGGGSEKEDLFFWVLGEIQDEVFRAVPDTGATLPIVARRLLRNFKKAKTVAITVGGGRTIYSLRGVDVSICLGV